MIYVHQMTVQVKELKNEDYKDWSQEVGFFFYLFLSLDENRKRIEAYSCLVSYRVLLPPVPSCSDSRLLFSSGG